MAHCIMVVPAGLGSGLTTSVLGLIHALERQGIKAGFFKPIAQLRDTTESEDRTVSMLRASCHFPIAEPVPMRLAEHLVSESKMDVLLETILENFNKAQREEQPDIFVIEGLVSTNTQPYANSINRDVASALDADVVLVAAPGLESIDELEDHIDIVARFYGGAQNAKVLGCLFNKLEAPLDRDGNPRPDLASDSDGIRSASLERIRAESRTLFNERFYLLGGIPWHPDMVAPRVSDIIDYLQAGIIYPGEMRERRVEQLLLCAQTIGNTVHRLKPGTLAITPADRDDMILAVALAASNGVKLAGLILSGGMKPAPSVINLCQKAIESGLPVAEVTTDSWHTALSMPRFSMEIPVDDLHRLERVKDIAATGFDPAWISSLKTYRREPHLSPAAFRHQLAQLARQADKRIVLPEGEEPRTLQAAQICGERGIARCVLLGNPEKISELAANQGITLGSNVEVIDPALVRMDYVDRLVALRQHRGMTASHAHEELLDNVVLGTLMLEAGVVDGLVSGAIHTTANTIRPALQLIKTAPGVKLVSSIFFMLLPDQVLVYGDCAINPDPDAEQLADIALQSADSAAAFGIEPRVAMISYSTGQSGQGADVDKVREATHLAKARRPDLLIDGPLQYDAAIMESVARSKAPDSPVAGRATVVVFPDLNTGNTTYKAVQRSADVISIGPMLQGMRKPVNDLSRGALVDDIVYTIALTAIQSKSVITH